MNVSKGDMAIIVAPSFPKENRGMVGEVGAFVPTGGRVKFKLANGDLIIFEADAPSWIFNTPRPQKIGDAIGYTVYAFSNVVWDRDLRKISGPPIPLMEDDEILKLLEEKV